MAGEQKYLVADELQARRVAALVSGLKIDGKPWQITVCRYVKKRALPHPEDDHYSELAAR